MEKNKKKILGKIFPKEEGSSGEIDLLKKEDGDEAEAPTEVLEEKKDTVIKKTTETITVKNEQYHCELVKNKITGNISGIREEIDSIVIKRNTTGKTIVKFKNQEEASDFLKLCMTLSIQLSEDSVIEKQLEQIKNKDLQNEAGSSLNSGKAEKIQTDYGEVEFRQEPLGNKKVDTIDDIFSNIESKANPYVEAMSGGQTLSESIGLQGITEDQLTEEQKRKIQEYKKNNSLKTSAFFNTENTPSKLKQERMKKLKEKRV